MLVKVIKGCIVPAEKVQVSRIMSKLYAIEHTAPDVIDDVCENLCVHCQTAQSQDDLDKHCAKCGVNKLLAIVNE